MNRILARIVMAALGLLAVATLAGWLSGVRLGWTPQLYTVAVEGPSGPPAAASVSQALAKVPGVTQVGATRVQGTIRYTECSCGAMVRPATVVGAFPASQRVWVHSAQIGRLEIRWR